MTEEAAAAEEVAVEELERPVDDTVPSDATIQVRGVTKKFGDLVAVDDLSFAVRRGEIAGFLGPNGSGKTTTMRMLTSFYTPDIGTIEINGVDTQQDDLSTRASIGYLPENNPLYEDMLVSEYLFFVAELRGLSGKDRKENMDRTVEETGISEVFYRPIHQLSKGYHQRVGLAQAILHRPSVLVLDEPTEGLDPNQRLTIRDLIRHLGGDRTVLLSTHVMQEVENTCERVLVISRGKLVANNEVQELLAHAKGLRSVDLEVEGENVESGLAAIDSISSVEPEAPVENRKRYKISMADDGDPRPDIFALAVKRNWVIWELHEVQPRLEDVFHDLTVPAEDADERVE
ncbi:MAG: ATP-binding cassette domain-containing protein [SAR202 cluster bacterium]|jgi:ABC-2 type transport system ATP-binding protein|nr:ATP-binding cassette domain-containing protein [SAR202 cluster bacterium]